MMSSRIKAYAAVMMLAVMLTMIAAIPSQAGLFSISERSELKMGRDAAAQIESRYPVSRDPRLNDMVTDIGLRIVRVSERPNLPWQFKVLELNDVNALSVPGYVYINRGLIDFVRGDRDQLASVIAHEIGHTTGRHAVEQAEKEMKYGLLLGLVLRGSAAQYGSIAANLALLGYSRKDEHDADKRAVHYLARAGYDMNGMTRFFQNLNTKHPDNARGLTVYFRTHPPTPDRMARVQQEINSIRSGARA